MNLAFKPYFKRLSKYKNKKLYGLVRSRNENIREEIVSNLLDEEYIDDISTNIHEYMEKDIKYDFIILDFNKMIEDVDWELLDNYSYLVMKDTDINFEWMKKFRKQHKATNELMRFEDWLLFKKEDFSIRGKHDSTMISAPTPQEPVYRPDDSHLKLDYIQMFGKGCQSFIETGTYMGQTVELIATSGMPVERIYSIEIDANLASRAQNKFAHDSRIFIIKGDSVDVIPDLLAELSTMKHNAVFWLDAHASGPLPGGKTGPSPLLQELEFIRLAGNPNHTIFIDDRRLFGSAEWGGLQEHEVIAKLNQINPDYHIHYLDGEVKNDIICATIVNPWGNEDDARPIEESQRVDSEIDGDIQVLTDLY